MIISQCYYDLIKTTLKIEEIEMYEVIDRKTGLRIGIYKTSKAAIRAVNRLDNIYGACRYYKKTIE